MPAIWKQQLDVTGEQVVALPKGSELMCVQAQRDIPCVWFLVPDTTTTWKEERRIYIYGTGHEHEQISGKYLGTYQLHGGSLVFHVFID